MTGIPGITYETPRGEIKVQRLWDAEQIELKTAAAAMKLLAGAYAYQFEREGGPLLPGTSEAHFNAEDDKKVVRQARRMQMYIEKKGSQYWIIEDEEIAGFALAGLAKISPSRSGLWQKTHLESPGVYLNDIVVAPHRQRQGLAGLMVDAATGYSGFDSNRALAADIFTDNHIAAGWFSRLGLVPVEKDLPGLRVNGQVLPQRRMTTQPTRGIADVRDELHHRHPLFSKAYITYP